MFKIFECSICNRIVPENRTMAHFSQYHKRLPPSAMRYNSPPKCSYKKAFILCSMCHKTIPSFILCRMDHQQKYHSELPAAKLFNNEKTFMENAVFCIHCGKFVPVRLFDTHLKEEHPGEHIKQKNVNNIPNPNTDSGSVKPDDEESLNENTDIIEPAHSGESKQKDVNNILNPNTDSGSVKPDEEESLNENTDIIEPAYSGESKQEKTKVDDAELEEQIFVRCNYCGRELPPNFIDDHILQEHVTDIEDNDEDEIDDSVSLSRHNNGNNSANEQHSGTNQTLNDSKASIMTHVNCDYCSKKVRLNKIEKHIQRKHSKEMETKKKRKRKISKTGSVEILPPNKSRRISESVSLNGDEHKNQGEDEEDFYTIYVSKNELEKFLLAKRVYPKNGMFHLKDAQN